MKALLDEHLSAGIAEELRSRGLDVIAVTERTDLVRSTDAHLMDIAAIEGRAVITNNIKDFHPIAAQRLVDGHGHGGLILLPAARSRTRSATHPLANAIEAVMTANSTGIVNSERWVPPTI